MERPRLWFHLRGIWWNLLSAYRLPRFARFHWYPVAVDNFGTFFPTWQLRYRPLRRECNFIVLALRRCYLDYFVCPYLCLAVKIDGKENPDNFSGLVYVALLITFMPHTPFTVITIFGS